MFQYKNIIVKNFTFIDEEFMGECGLTVPPEICKEFFYAEEYYVYDEGWIHKSEEEQQEPWTVYHADQQIVMFHWMFNQPDRTFVVEYEGSTPFWFFHDCKHAENDVVYTSLFKEVFVTAGIEEERIWEGFDIMVEKGLWHAMTTDLSEFFYNITEAFAKRWNGYYFSTEYAIKRLGIYDEDEYYA